MYYCKCTIIAGIHCTKLANGTYGHDKCGGIVPEETAKGFDDFYAHEKVRKYQDKCRFYKDEYETNSHTRVV